VRGIGVSRSGYNKVLALEVLNVVDRVEQRRRAEFPASASASRAVAAALSFQACLRAGEVGLQLRPKKLDSGGRAP